MQRREFMQKVGPTILTSAIVPSFLLKSEQLPEGVHLFSLNGQTEFVVYGDSGGISTETVSYLISENGLRSWGFNPRKQSQFEASLDFDPHLSI